MSGASFNDLLAFVLAADLFEQPVVRVREGSRISTIDLLPALSVLQADGRPFFRSIESTAVQTNAGS